MAQGPVPLIEPGSPPPRPDRPPESRSLLFPVFVFVSALAIVFSILAVRSLLRGPVRAGGPPPPTSPPTISVSPSSSASPTPTQTPSPSPEPPPSAEGTFAFINRVPEGGPVRWNPCEPITYSVNQDGANFDVRPDLEEALDRVTDATGIRFESVGDTNEGFLHAWERMRFKGVIGKAKLIVIWVDHADYLTTLRRLGDRRPSIALAKPMAGAYQDRDQYFGGLIMVDADLASRPGFESTSSHGLILLHELGHILGLAHVKDPNQVMYSGPDPNPGLRGYGLGDLAGLRQLGRDAGCLA